MKIKYLLLINALIFLCTGCANQTNPVALNPIGKIYSGAINLEDMELPLPEGEWKVVGRGFSKDFFFVEVILEKDIANKPCSIIKITRETPISKNPVGVTAGMMKPTVGYESNEGLLRTNMLHVVVANNNHIGSQDGWLINHVIPAHTEKDSQADDEAFKHIIDSKLISPANYLQIYHHFTGGNQKYLDYSIFVNPEAYGFDPPINAEWASSDWNIFKINNAPPKVAFVEKLKSEGALFHEKLQEAFRKTPDIYQETQSYRKSR